MGYNILIPVGLFVVAAVIGVAWRSWWALLIPFIGSAIFSVVVAYGNRGTETDLQTAFGLVFVFLFPIAAAGTIAGIVAGRHLTSDP